MDKVITISRQYGSGGREIGAKLAEKFSIPFYDNELITRAAKESGFAEAAFENAESKASNSLLYSIAMGMNSYGNQELGFSHLSLDDRIYLAQSDVIRKVAAEGSCVLVGRCADYILRDDPDCVHVFISARMEDRIWRALEYNKDLTEKDAEDTVRKADKSRASYYNYYTDKVWGAAESYDLCVNSSLYGLEETVDYILSFLKRP